MPSKRLARLGGRPLKSNDMGALLEELMVEALDSRECSYWRLHTIRSFKGVSNPCDFIVLDKRFTALLECKATNNDSFSCSGSLQQLEHFEKSVRFEHIGLYGLAIMFYSKSPIYVFVSDSKVIENRDKRRRVRLSEPLSFSFAAQSLQELLKGFEL